MGFIETRFPDNYSYDSKGGPGFKSHIIETDSGSEEIVSRWSYPRHKYDASYAIRSYEDLAALKAFYMAMQGAANGFRFKDWLDFTSSEDGRSAPTNTDQIIAVCDGNETQFQLRKGYTEAGTTRWRKITKPVADTVVLALNGSPEVGTWSIDTTTGIITFTGTPGVDQVLTAGFEFDVPVRFGEDIDEQLEASADDFSSGSVDSIELVELVDTTPIDEEFFYGGAQYCEVTVNFTLSVTAGRVVVMDVTAASKKALLPATTDLPLGGPYFYLMNVGTEAIDVCKSDGTVIRSLAINKSCIVVLGLNSSAVKTWHLLEGTAI